jgi:hypothetical protein
MRLDELGSVQFQRFCSELIGVEEVEDADFLPWGFSLLRREGIVLPGGGRLPGPALVLVVWLRRRAFPPAAAEQVERIATQAVSGSTVPPASMLLMTNVAGAAAPSDLEAVVLGANELWEALSARPELRFRLPFLLGVVDHSQLVVDDVARRSTFDSEAAAALARVFVPTRAYAHALDVLGQHRFVVLSGPPEMGKTAIARVLGLAAQSDGWEVHECVRPDELWQSFDRGRRQLFIADDAFGSTEYRPDTAERWALELDRVLHALDQQHWLIWTSRPTPLRAALRRIHREHGVERFPQPAEVGVDAAGLDIAEKALILFRHAMSADVGNPETAVVRACGWEIVSHPHFTPERIRRFVDGRLVELAEQAGDIDIPAAVAEEIREPTAAMAASYGALASDLRAVLIALLDTVPGLVTERELTTALRRHSPECLSRPIAESVDQLADHFLRRVPPASVTWVHPSWRDLVIDELAADDRARSDFLRACSIHGAALALSTAGGSTGERALPLLRQDADWDALGDRLATILPELHPPETTLLLAALSEANTSAPTDARVELDALAGETLSRLGAAWHAAVPVGILAAWVLVAAGLGEPPALPTVAVAATWIDALPPTAPDLTVTGQIGALDDWLALAELLTAHAPEMLQRFDFPASQTATLRAIIAAARHLPRADIDPPARTLLVRVLRRIARLVPALAYDATEAIDRHVELARPAALEPQPELRDLSPELERLLEIPLRSTRRDQGVVTRVLRDL